MGEYSQRPTPQEIWQYSVDLEALENLEILKKLKGLRAKITTPPNQDNSEHGKLRQELRDVCCTLTKSAGKCFAEQRRLEQRYSAFIQNLRAAGKEL